MTASTSKTEFTFYDTNSSSGLKVTIPEVTSGAYGLYIWPCSPVLAQFIWERRTWLKNKNVLELGAGTALPGIVAAKCGANVILSDTTRDKNCLDRCTHSANVNALPGVKVVGITWGEVSPVLCDIDSLDVILASDCFYDKRDFEDILMTMAFLLEKNPEAQVWCSYQERSSERNIQYLLHKWNLGAEYLNYPDMSQLVSTYDKHLKCVIQLFVIKKCQQEDSGVKGQFV